jgi:hypothetical protein
VEDILFEKGVITMDDWVAIKGHEERRLGESAVVAEFTASPRWFERLRHYGYGMFRYNRLGNPNGKLDNWQDASVGTGNPGFYFRRIRWVITGQVSDRVSVFIQPDLASNFEAGEGGSGSSTSVATLRDAWGEYYLDQKKEFRFRVGLQRVPCSFDNWQASRQRIAIDRADATNSCSPSERDLGLSFQWTPHHIQQRWRHMIDYLYGAGDWGVVNLSVWNGQGLNQKERNNNKHVGIRLAYPFELPGGRLMEIGMNAMRGMYNVDPGTPNSNNDTLFSFTSIENTNKMFARKNYLDERVNAYIYYPPQPWGLIAEYTTGRGPRRRWDGLIESRSLYGGYVQLSYQHKYSDLGLANFYGRWQEYYGGIKTETGAPDARMKELELGMAWQPDPQWEITLAYTFTQRLNFEVMQPVNTTNPTVGQFGICNTSNPIPSLAPDNTGCTPGAQYNPYANLIRLQIIWFWN